MDIKEQFVTVSKRNEEHFIENWKKRDPCYKMEKNFGKLCLCSSVLWTVKLVNN